MEQDKDLFGAPVVNLKRSMADFFGVPPFSILNTVEGTWQARKQRWNEKIGDTGQARANVLGAEGSLIAEIGGTSILDAVLAETMIKWFTEPGFNTFDPFAGDTVFGFVSAWLKRPFTGIELREEQVQFNQAQCNAHNLPATYICDNGLWHDRHIQANSQDFLFTCPPYADLEVYSDLPGDISNMPHQDFFKVYAQILHKTYSRLKNNRFAVVVTSEVRDKKTGEYINLVGRTVNIMLQAGYLFYNDIILVNAVGSLPMRSGKSMNSSRKVGRRHQNVLVFFKGNPHEIKKDFSELIPKNQAYDY